MEEGNDFFVSVIIPAFNAVKYIKRAVLSASDIHNVKEIVIIEDGSNDDTLNICKIIVANYPKAILFQHPDKKNHGAAASRNLGIKKSTCKYIAFLDADDYYLENRFTKANEIFAQDPNADGIYDAIGIQFEENMPFDSFSELYTLKEKIQPKDLFYSMDPIGDLGFFSLNGLTLKRNALLKTEGFETKLNICEDTFLIFQLAVHCRLVAGNLKKPVAISNRHNPFSLTNNSKLLLKSHLKFFIYLIRWLRKNKAEHKKINSVINAYFERMFFYWAYKCFKSYFIYIFRIYVIIYFNYKLPRFCTKKEVLKHYRMVLKH